MTYKFKERRWEYYSSTCPKRGTQEWLTNMNDWFYDNFPDKYEKEALKYLEMGLKPYKGIVLNGVALF